MQGVDARYEDVDLVIVRENTEDLYAGIEHMVGPDAAESIKIITRAASERIARFAFEYAVANGRRKVTAVHKANIMKLSDGLFLESCRTVAADYEGRIEFEDRIVDNMCMQLVQKPELYDVLVLPNLYGDIVSDLCAGLVGGLGVAPGANIGTDAAVFEPVHGSAPKYAGQDKANPTALILSGRADAPAPGLPGPREPRRDGRPRRHRRGQARPPTTWAAPPARPRSPTRSSRGSAHRPAVAADDRAARPASADRSTAAQAGRAPPPRASGATTPRGRLVVVGARASAFWLAVARPLLGLQRAALEAAVRGRRTRSTATCRRSSRRSSATRCCRSARRRRS